MIIQCMIKRDGVTEVTRGGKHYRFEKNVQGDEVCDIHDTAHAKMFLRMGERYYRKYGAANDVPDDLDADIVVNDLDEDGDTFDEFVPITEGKAEHKVVAAPLQEEKQPEPLDDEEQLVYDMMVAGDTATSIGAALGISRQAAGPKIKAIKEKLGLD